jgi:hypothetical protein
MRAHLNEHPYLFRRSARVMVRCSLLMIKLAQPRESAGVDINATIPAHTRYMADSGARERLSPRAAPACGAA